MPVVIRTTFLFVLHIIGQVPGSLPTPSQALGASLWELLSPHARCLGRTSSRSHGFTGGFKSPCLRPDSLAMLGYFLEGEQAHANTMLVTQAAGTSVASAVFRQFFCPCVHVERDAGWVKEG